MTAPDAEHPDPIRTIYPAEAELRVERAEAESWQDTAQRYYERCRALTPTPEEGAAIVRIRNGNYVLGDHAAMARFLDRVTKQKEKP